MNKVTILAASITLLLTGCGDKDTSATGDTEPSMLEKTMEATKDAGSSVKEMAGDAADTMGDAYDASKEKASGAMDAVGETTSGAVDATKAAAADVYDAAKEKVHETAQGIADATAEKHTTDTMEAAEGAMKEAGDVMPR